jgi:mono/diheme cytochrome c family protein
MPKFAYFGPVVEPDQGGGAPGCVSSGDRRVEDAGDATREVAFPWEGKMISISRTTAAIAVLVLAAAAARADDMGKTDFMQGCAGCHGETAMGQGPLAEFLTVEVPDLTQLSARNDGTFPMLDVIHIIDGRTGMRPHGDPMPIWGAIFKSGALGESGIYGGAEAVARGRILSVAYYLESIQK